MLKKAKEFIKDAGGWGLTSCSAAAILFCLAIWEHAHNKPVPTLVFFCLTVPLFWIGSFIAWLKKNEAFEIETALHGGPEISLSWAAVPPLNRQKTLFLENSGPIDAYEVKIGDIGLDKTHCRAQFPVIPKCPKGSVTPAAFQLYGDQVPQHEKNNLEMVVYASQSDFRYDAEGRPVVEFPITVAFQEYGGARFAARFLLVADTDMSKVNIHRVSRERIWN